MPLKPLALWISHSSQKIPLRLALIVPFLLQVSAAVGLTGYLSFRNGEQAINEVTQQLRVEIGSNIHQTLRYYLEAPQTINRVNVNAIQLNQLNLQDTGSLTRQFWHQRFLFDSANVSAMYFASIEGEFFGLGFQDNQQWEIGRAGKSTGGKFFSYDVDSEGNPTDLLQEGNQYDPRVRPWYKTAVQAGEEAWSDIYIDFKDPRLKITLVQPIYSKTKELRGVAGVDFVLSHVQDFLKNLKVGKSGKTFIMERSGLMVASSTEEEPFLRDSKGKVEERLQAKNSKVPLIKAAVNYLDKSVNLAAVDSTKQFTFELEGKPHFLQITPLADDRGINWLIAVIIPKTDFMEQIHANNRTTVWLCLGALALSATLGVFTTRWLTSPIVLIGQAAIKIASGKLDQHVEGGNIAELKVLANSFNQMADQLRESFFALKQAKTELEQRVIERTAALQHSEEKFSKAFHSSPIPFIIITLTDGNFIEVNESFLKFSDYSVQEVIGYSCLDLNLWADSQKYELVHQLLLQHASFRSLELEFRTKFDKIKVGLVSAEVVEISDIQCLLVTIEDITKRKQAEEALRIEQEKSERLLLNILPKPIADQLKHNTSAIAEQFSDATILFADIVGFTPLSSRMSPIELVNLLNQIFSTFDQLAEKHRLEKIKTIGDAYMIAGGLPIPRSDHAQAVAVMALDMQQAIAGFQVDKSEPFQIRIGINTGPVVAGVIGIKKFIYDLWGDTVNIASRMESQGVPGGIQVSANTYQRLHNQFRFEKRGAIAVKGKGEMITYWLKDYKDLS
ncbi:MAG: PAS domain S-box protein [Symploca sp. SIO1B1]|nr:PAS domain S-box protein [Symploca sp. SIO1B1]